MRSWIAFASLLVTASVASASPATDAPYARHDIVDARHGEMPMRHHVLGWTPDGEVVVREATPAADALVGFSASLRITGSTGAPRSTSLVSIQCDGEDACDIPYTTARDFIVRERQALAALPPLTEATPQDGAWHLRSAERLRLRTRTGDHSRRRPYGQRLELVVGEGRTARRVAIVTDVWLRAEDDPDRIEGARIAAVYDSPARDRVAVVVEWTLGFNCWSAPQLTTIVVPIPAA
jgi:hypothetical protein